jgi:sulfhydrogenase subunit alpha
MSEVKPKNSESKTIRVNMLARVEGEGALHIDIDNGDIKNVHLSIFEPPRFFEAFLEGRHYSEVSDIVARICGICPVAYQMSAVHALEKLFEVKIDPEVRKLRRLLYCGEWIESHALHIYMLQAPDFVGLHDSLELAKTNPELVKQGLRLKKVGDEILKTLGGRAVHPVSVRVGGFTKAPSKKTLHTLLEDLKWARGAAVETLKWTATLDFPDFELPYTFVSVSHQDEYPFNEGDIAVAGPSGCAVHGVADFEMHFKETHAEYTHALHCHYHDEPYLVGPLARVNLNADKLSAFTRSVLAETGLTLPFTNPFKGIVARSVELLECIEESIAIVESYSPPKKPYEDYEVKAGECMAATEAPRGLLYHHYKVNAEGIIESAKIVPPTSQNQTRIEADMRALLPSIQDQSEDDIAHACEKVIRCYDPCISCATHFLKLDIKRS